MEQTANTLWVTGYSARGYKVSLTLAVDADNLTADIARLLAAVEAAGVLPREQGVEAGEEVETVHAAVRREQIRDDRTTPIIDLYNERLNYRSISVYLNTPDDIAAFEAATGVKLASMQVMDADAAIERESPRFAKYAAVFAAPAQYVRKLNPQHEKDDKKPKYKFLRWHGVAPAPQTAPAQTGETKANAPADPLRLLDDDAPKAPTFKDAKDLAEWAAKMRELYKVPAEVSIKDIIKIPDINTYTGGRKAAEKKIEVFMIEYWKSAS